MAKFLRVDPDFDHATQQLTGANWRLPGDTDMSALRDRLLEAAKDGEAVALEVEMSDDPRNRQTVIVNPSSARSILLAEVGEQGR